MACEPAAFKTDTCELMFMMYNEISLIPLMDAAVSYFSDDIYQVKRNELIIQCREFAGQDRVFVSVNLDEKKLAQAWVEKMKDTHRNVQANTHYESYKAYIAKYTHKCIDPKRFKLLMESQGYTRVKDRVSVRYAC